ncbi:g87 [Coccomyxa elongata]
MAEESASAEASQQSAATGSEILHVPKAVFIEDVAAFLEGRTADEAIKELNANYQNYKLIEQELQQSRLRLVAKIPEIQKALAAVEMLINKQQEGQEVVLDFGLSEQIFAKAKVKDVSSVGLWLGADVMLEYPLEEAKQLLTTNLNNAKENLKTNSKEVDIMKDFSTTTEVSIARIYNFDVTRKRTSKEGKGGG